MYDRRLNLANEVAQEARRSYGRKVYETVIPRNVKLSESPSFGKPILHYDAQSAGAESYMHLAREVIGLPRPNCGGGRRADSLAGGIVTRRALGRGLEALIPTGAPADEVDGRARHGHRHHAIRSRIDRIVPNRYNNHASHFDDEKLRELAAVDARTRRSPTASGHAAGERFELVAGERRLRAARIAGLQRVPVLVRDVDARESLKLAMLENVQREDLNPIEEALGYRRLGRRVRDDAARNRRPTRQEPQRGGEHIALAAACPPTFKRASNPAKSLRAMLAHCSAPHRSPIATSSRCWSANTAGACDARKSGRMIAARRSRRKPSRTRHTIPNPALQELEQRLEKHFGTRVRIHARKADGSAGRIEIEYYTTGDLERIFAAAGIPYLL